MGLFGSLFSSSSSSASSTSSTQNTTDARVATDNGGLAISGANGTINNDFSANVLAAFGQLATLTAGSLELVSQTVDASSKAATGALTAVTAAPNQIGSENATLLKLAPYAAMLVGAYLVIKVIGK